MKNMQDRLYKKGCIKASDGKMDAETVKTDSDKGVYINRKIGIAALRTSALLRTALFRLLGNIPFEKITLTRLCKEAMIPRSTFYRYFEDKFDLLNHSIDIFIEENRVKSDTVFFYSPQTTADFINILIEKIDLNKAQYKKIFEINKEGILFLHLQKGFMRVLEKQVLDAEMSGLFLQLDLKIFTLLMSNFILYCARIYLDEAENAGHDVFAENIKLFIEKKFFKAAEQLKQDS